MRGQQHPPLWALGMGSSAARAGEVKFAEVAIVVEVDATVVLGANTGSPVRDAAGGKTPRGVNATPVREKPTIGLNWGAGYCMGGVV